MNVRQSALKLIKHSAVYGLGSGAGRFVGLLSLPLYTSFLSPEEYGVIGLLLVVGILLRTLCAVGSGGATGIVYFKYASAEHKRHTIWSMLALVLMGCVLLLSLSPVVEFLLDGFLTDLPSILSTKIIIGYCFVLVLQIATEPFLISLQFDGRAKVYSVVSFAGVLVGVLFTIAFLVADFGVSGWVLGQGIGAFISLLIAWMLTRKDLGFPKPQYGLMRDILRTWTPLLPGSFSMLFMLSAAPFYVGEFLPIESVGKFGVGYQLGMGMALVTSAISAAWMPYFQSYMERPEEANKLFPKMTVLYIWGVGGVSLIFFYIARPVIEILVDIRYKDAWEVIGFVALSQALVGLWGMLLPGMYFSAETKYVTLVQVLAAIAAVVSYYVLIPEFGLIGAGIALVVGPVVMVVLQAILNRLRNYQVSSFEVIPATSLLSWIFMAAAVIWFAWGNTSLLYAGILSLFVLVTHIVIGWRIYHHIFNN
ncbi:lipopolysaccharide biosynthesis protein [Sedimenticola selenatireducens]|uniref:Lipopolysaccharide biosynthesis protein n=1 Tax=Sedimenticola selenatireducens TaxID=191960 RepID=A0A557S4W0_9GAMM|nr:lipopolysaccharide biosynthesis protein [Sedimenticola selenatireducens]TVO72435.1 lipopolysaccharide biosynthesis protein [Sedimenticola selenatireducens]TVT64690.1 MAG: lipopolysaccharide biosynthesis protein [Sedimenticola selenatireducens]